MNNKKPLILIFIFIFSLLSCQREEELSKLRGIRLEKKEELIKEVENFALKHKIDQVKEISKILEGVVLDENHIPKSEVLLLLEKEDKSFIFSPQKTDKGGCFAFLNIPYGEYILKVKEKEKILAESKIEVDCLEKDVGIIYIKSSLPEENKGEKIEELEEETKVWSEEKEEEKSHKEKLLVEKEPTENREEIKEKSNLVSQDKEEQKIVIEEEISLPFCLNDITWDGQYLWGISKSYLYQIDPKDGNVISNFWINILEGTGLTWDGKYLWCADCFMDKIFKVDPKSKQVVDMFYVPDAGYHHYGMAFDGNYLWYSSSNACFYKLSPQDGKVISFFLEEAPGCHNSLAWDGKYLWSTIWNQSMICQIDPKNGQIVKKIVLDFNDPIGITFDGKNLWIVSYHQRKLFKVKME
ncbi:glutaminyl-peptide cyclotransferase [bacterium]|nr:glutaminyl-peptide cyclotransferase [bacterium]MBU1154094.1 glutaminyl-peptide cyclotransferase [bacterium]